MDGEQPLVSRAPFRAPHHSASTAAIVVGGPHLRPGEASLAHRGVLLLDELAEFQRPVLEALRQPLEDGFVSVSRAVGRVVFPARFMLVATMNLCPCGGRGDPAAQCSCSAQRLARYRDKLSRALLDRFDLVLAMPRVRGEELAAAPSESSTAVAGRVAVARERLATKPPSRDVEADALLRRAADRLHLSGRGYARVGRVARTIAALAEVRVGSRRARGGGSLLSLSGRARRMSELALAVFASETGTHLIRPPRGERWRAFERRFDERAYLERLAAAGHRFLPRSSPDFPPLLRAIHDPPAGLFLRGVGKPEALGPAGRRDRRSAGVLGLRRLRRPLARSGARRRPGSSSRAALPAASTPRRIAVRSRRRGRPSPSSAAASTATTPPHTPSSRAASRMPASSSRSTRQASSPPPGGFPPATASSPACAPRPSSSRHASEAARSSRQTSPSRRGGRCSRCRARSRPP